MVYLGMAKVRSNIRRSLSALETQVKTGLETVIDQRGKTTLELLKTATTGPGRAARFAASPANPGYPGRGVDVPLTTLEPNIIGNITGELRSRLEHQTVVKRDKVVAEIGFGKSIRAKAGAGASGINAKTQGPPVVNVVPVPVSRRWPKPEDKYTPNARPEEYISDVLLGTKTLVGRNVLRLALYDDIMKKKSHTVIKEYLQGVVKSIGVPF